METSLTLFKIFGIKVRVHWSFLLIIVYGAFMFRGRGDSLFEGALYGILVTLLLFVCVTLHEFGHALAAKYYDIKVPTITLLPIGGVASLERMPDKPYQELVIAVAGPVVNIVIAAFLFPIVAFMVGMDMRNGAELQDLLQWFRTMLQPGFVNLLIYLLVTNLLLAIFNLLPAFPMDGGRILRAVLAMGMPYVNATRIAVFVGRLMAGLFAVWGIMGGGIFLLLIAFFVYIGGSSELDAVRSRSILRKIPALRALTPAAVNLYTSERLSRAVDMIMSSHQTDYPVLNLSGQFVGVLTRDRLVNGLRDTGAETRIVDVMLPAAEVPICRPNEMLAEVWERMIQRNSRVVAVMEHGVFSGLITFDDISEVIRVIGAASDGSRRPPGGSSTSTTAETTSNAGI